MTVKALKVSIKFQNRSGRDLVIGGFFTPTGIRVASTVEEIYQQHPYSKWKITAPYSAGNSSSTATLNFYMTHNKVWGVKIPQYDTTYSQDIQFDNVNTFYTTSEPTYYGYFHWFIIDPNGATYADMYYTAEVRVKYYTQMYSRRNVSYNNPWNGNA